MTSGKVVKTLYGTMFEIVTHEGMKRALLTQDTNRAVFILPEREKRCPRCSSDKCLDNVMGESMVFPEYFKDADGIRMAQIRFLGIAGCRKGKGDFIIIRSSQPRQTKEGLCTWCNSPHAEKISNLAEARKSFFLPFNLKKYKWMVWRQEDGVADEGVIYAQMEGMAVDEVSIFSFKEPWKCKHCKRVFGYEVDAEEGQVLFNKLVDEVRMKSLNEYLEKLGIPKEAAVFKYVKCPSCSCPPDYGKWMADVFPSPPWVREVSGFYIYKYKCQECSKEFFGVLDIYNNDMMMRKFMY